MANKVLLVILDGWGLSANEYGNAPLLAKTPVLDYVYSAYPKTSLSASGLEVGLSPGEPGNSEVGHMNMGSGRIVWENLPRIDQVIESGELFRQEELVKVVENASKKDSTLHLIGLVSDGGVHSHVRHLLALLDFADKKKVKNIFVHFIADGRDTAPEKALSYAEQIEEKFAKIGTGRIATLIGRYFAMDRDKNWDRSEKAALLFLNGAGQPFPTVKEAIQDNYSRGKSDEFLEPGVIGEPRPIQPGDSVIFFNHRSDRMNQLVHQLAEEKPGLPSGVKSVSMVLYAKDQAIPAVLAPINLSNTLSEIIAGKKLPQLHTAETEKYAHVTYFFRAGREETFALETDKLVPSKKTTYDKLPQMSAAEVTQVVLKGIAAQTDFIVVNYANGDMVGHTGNLTAAIEACQAVDNCLGQVLPSASAAGYKTFITADHGNCEVMVDELTKSPNKEHTTNPVPFVFLDFQTKPFVMAEAAFSKEDYLQYACGTPIGVLADVAPSILANLEIAKPEEISGMDLSVAML